MPGQQPRDEWRRVVHSMGWRRVQQQPHTDGRMDRQTTSSRTESPQARPVSSRLATVAAGYNDNSTDGGLLVAIVTHSHSPPRELRSNLCRIQNIILDSMYHAQWQWEAVSLHTDICWATSLRLGEGTAEEVEIISIAELFICGCSGPALKWPLTMRVSG